LISGILSPVTTARREAFCPAINKSGFREDPRLNKAYHARTMPAFTV
jgi:hypothetical protein